MPWPLFPRPLARPSRGWIALFLALLVLAPCRAGSQRFLVDGNVRGVLDQPHGLAAQSQFFKRLALEEGEGRAWLLSTGNVLGPATESYADGGRPVLDLMNQLPYDAMAIGAMDLFLGVENLLGVLSGARFPVVASNLRPREDQAELLEKWSFVKPWVRLQRGERSVLVLGLYSPEDTTYGPDLDPRLEVRPLETTLIEVDAIRRPQDTVVVLGDLSFHQCRRLLKSHSWIDLVFLNESIGDSEQFADSFDHGFPDGRRLVWVPYFGAHLASVELYREPRRRSLAHVIPLDRHSARDPEADAVIRDRAVREDADEVALLTTLDDWEMANFHQSITNALRVELQAEVGMIRKGTVRNPNPARRFTRSALRAVYPFTDRVRMLRVKGSKLRELWGRRNESVDPNRHLVFTGLKEVDGVLTVNGRRLDNHQRYRLATVGKLLEKGVGIFEEGRQGRIGKKAFDVLVDFYSHPGSRHQRTLRAKYRTIKRFRTALDFYRKESAFGGSAPDYQLKIPGRANLSSDIPGLVGREFISAGLNFNHKFVQDHADHDLIFELDARYSTWNSTTINEYLDADLRFERKSPASDRPQLFAEISGNTVLSDQGLPNRERPLFVKSSSGLVWKPGASTKLFGGLGYIKRLSQPGNPGSLGLDFGYEWKRETWRGVTLRSTLDGFLSGDSDKVRTADFMLELRVQIGGPLSTVLRQRTFSWKDATVNSRAVRNESFIGLSLESLERRY